MRHLSVGACIATICVAACDEAGPKSQETTTLGVAGANSSPPAVKVAPVGAGPFGIAFGTPIASLDAAPGERPGFYTVNRIPRPHPDIEAVYVQAFPETGVCFIKGVGRDLENDGAGTQARPLTDHLAEQLATKYGEVAVKDQCSGYACESEHWTMHINGGTRAYFYEWPKKSTYPDRVQSIALGVMSTDINTPYVAIEYYGDNTDACVAAEKRAGAASL